jgi:hypothetical protein
VFEVGKRLKSFARSPNTAKIVLTSSEMVKINFVEVYRYPKSDKNRRKWRKNG